MLIDHVWIAGSLMLLAVDVDGGAGMQHTVPFTWPRSSLLCAAHFFIVLQYLIQQQVDLDAADSHEVRPLHLAAITNRLDIVQLLIDKGANPTKQDHNGDVPLHWAATKGLGQVSCGSHRVLPQSCTPAIKQQQLICMLHITSAQSIISVA